jgi:hypothetical protein
VPRGPVSVADAALVEEVRRRGVACSPYQLERWRTAGLLPRNTRIYPGDGGSASCVAPETVDIAVVLAGAARRGHGPEALALHLYATGLPVAGEVLVAAFVWAASSLVGAAIEFAELAAAAVRDLPADVERFGDPGDDADAIAARVLAANGASVRKMRRRLRAAQPAHPREERKGMLLSALSQMSTLMLPGAEPRGGDNQTPERTELLNAVGFDTACTPGSFDVLAAVSPEGLLQYAGRLTPDLADALYQARILVLEQAEQVRAGLTPIPASVEGAHPQNPTLFAIEVLTAIVVMYLDSAAE